MTCEKLGHGFFSKKAAVNSNPIATISTTVNEIQSPDTEVIMDPPLHPNDGDDSCDHEEKDYDNDDTSIESNKIIKKVDDEIQLNATGRTEKVEISD